MPACKLGRKNTKRLFAISNNKSAQQRARLTMTLLLHRPLATSCTHSKIRNEAHVLVEADAAVWVIWDVAKLTLSAEIYTSQQNRIWPPCCGVWQKPPNQKERPSSCSVFKYYGDDDDDDYGIRLSLNIWYPFPHIRLLFTPLFFTPDSCHVRSRY